MPDEVFESFDFGYPSPSITPDGTNSNLLTSDFSVFSNAGLKQVGIRVFNEDRFDGDALLFLELRPNKDGKFGTGFAQDLYVFKENFDTLNQEIKEREPEAFGFSSYDAPIEWKQGSPIRFAVVLIQDNETTNDKDPKQPATLRRTTLGGGADIKTNDFLSDNKNDSILAGAGNDVIFSGGGKDIVFGEAGDDEIHGGDGDDYLFGNQGNDRLFGDNGNDWLDGGLGNDLLVGGFGDDIYVVDSLEDKIQDSPGTGIETVRASINWTLQAGLDHLILTGDALTGSGNNLDNFIRGNNFGNTLEGGDGNDILFGDDITGKVRAGVVIKSDTSNDSTTIASAKDFLRYLGGFNDFQATTLQTYQIFLEELTSFSGGTPGGNDVLKGGSGNDKLFGWGGDDQIFGDDGNDWLFGGEGSDQLFGGNGDDRLEGGLGADRLEGGTGNDIYVIDDINDIIIDRSGTGIETVESSITFDLTKYSASGAIVGATGLDNLTLTGSTAIDAFGNNLPNILLGNIGNNVLNGREGDDTLIVSDGDDTLIGGLGSDKFRFNAIPANGKSIIQDFKPGEDIIEISKSAFGNPTLNQFSYDGTNLFFGSKSLATIQSSAAFNVNQSVRLV
jgi:Ca2+-binding RTX toxin-like protein